MPLFKKISIQGVGLIGGSIGLAALKRGAAAEVVGIGRNHARLEIAKEIGAVTSFTTDLAEGLEGSEMVILCSPVTMIVDFAKRCAEVGPQGLLITDAGSTKKTMVEALDGTLSNGCRFLGGHPLAGSEKTGAIHAKANLFDGKLAIITPTESSSTGDIDRLEQFWSLLGSKVVKMTPDEHDRTLAMTSHLPHAVAVALAMTLKPDDAPFTGSGFRSTSRLASGDPTMWDQIFTENRPYVLQAIENYIQQLQRLAEGIASGDSAALHDLLNEAKKIRDGIDS